MIIGFARIILVIVKHSFMKTIIAYIPVLHQGYIDFFQKNKAELILVMGRSVTDQFRPLAKDIRALDPEMIVSSIEALKLAKKVEIIELEDLEKIDDQQLIMPDEVVSRTIAGRYFLDKKIKFDNVFLRWDSKKSLTSTLVDPDQKITKATLHHKFIQKADKESAKSADWWRQVGAVIAKDGKIILSGHNTHLPSEQQPYIDGDPRADFHKGEHIDKSTALHAEAGLIAQAAKEGISLSGTSLYVTTFPCPNCAKLIAHSGIKKVYFEQGYSMVDGERVMKEAGVELIRVE